MLCVSHLCSLQPSQASDDGWHLCLAPSLTDPGVVSLGTAASSKQQLFPREYQCMGAQHGTFSSAAPHQRWCPQALTVVSSNCSQHLAAVSSTVIYSRWFLCSSHLGAMWASPVSPTLSPLAQLILCPEHPDPASPNHPTEPAAHLIDSGVLCNFQTPPRSLLGHADVRVLVLHGVW